MAIAIARLDNHLPQYIGRFARKSIFFPRKSMRSVCILKGLPPTTMLGPSVKNIRYRFGANCLTNI